MWRICTSCRLLHNLKARLRTLLYCVDHGKFNSSKLRFESTHSWRLTLRLSVQLLLLFIMGRFSWFYLSSSLHQSWNEYQTHSIIPRPFKECLNKPFSDAWLLKSTALESYPQPRMNIRQRQLFFQHICRPTEALSTCPDDDFVSSQRKQC